MLNALFWMAVGGLIVALIPPKYEDQIRLWIINKWQKITKKG